MTDNNHQPIPKRASHKWLAGLSITLVLLGIGMMLFSYATVSGQYKNAHKVLALAWFTQWKMNYPKLQESNDCSATWSPPMGGDQPYMLPTYPDTFSANWALIMSQDPTISTEPISYQLTAKFPYARHLAFHIYDAVTGNYLTSLKDVDIEPDAGSVNPFRSNIDRTAANRNYTIWIVPEGANLAQIRGVKNIIHVPKHVMEAPILMAIDRANHGLTPEAGVSLPRVKVFHAQSGAPVLRCNPLRIESLLPNQSSTLSNFQDRNKSLTIGDGQTIRLYRLTDEGLYPNQHFNYLTTALNDKFGNVALIKFKAPTTPHTKTGFGILSHEEDMRYWSVCLGGMNATNTSACLVDDQATVGDDGYITLAIGPDNNNLKNLAKQNKINYMNWGYHRYPSLIFRQVEAEKDFKYSIKNVPALDESLPIFDQGGERSIGVYSPTGFYCTDEQFEKNLCTINEYQHDGLEFMK